MDVGGMHGRFVSVLLLGPLLYLTRSDCFLDLIASLNLPTDINTVIFPPRRRSHIQCYALSFCDPEKNQPLGLVRTS